MDLRVFLLLLFLCSDHGVNAKPARGRGFIGHVDPEDSKLVRVDPVTANTLRSATTTVFLPIVYIVVFAVGLPANGMAIWVFLFRTKKKHPSSIYMANLALADLLFVIWTPLKIDYHLRGNDWTYGEPLCKVLMSFFYGNMYCSVLFIACISVQRYWVVAHPLSQQRKNNKVAVGVCLAIWAFIWLTTTPLYLYDHTAKLKDPNITTCHDVNVIQDPNDPFASVKLPYFYFIFMALVVFLVPCIIIIVAYILLLKALGNCMDDNTGAKNRQKAVILIVTVLITFVICFIPSNIMLVVHYSLVKDGVTNNGYAFYVTTLCLASLNSILDPFIYYFVSEDFRDHVKNTFLCRSSRTVEQMRVSFSSMKYSRKSKSYVSGNTQSSTC
ncbi:coagulation factor II (thrombin) receptor-like 1, tandem duplicate 2 [Synchiropus splendidus]|uniref:coagulation factor II (thrombin) receptor-like 1, tandem duplicate 2 n=1 Tax=Synchiropus splendidus TaxID=270530 RepID=UPI00237E4F8C|nr:coagulation factor II (thrombin) receptor-like 1, tandem duplicate 2 [Synchiropus splendidus]